MKSSLLTVLISIASVVSQVHAEVSQHTVKKYDNQQPFLSFFAQNRFLSLPQPPTKVTYGRDIIQVNVPAPLDTYLWELIGYFKAETTGEYIFSIGETKAAAIQLGTKNTTSANFHDNVLGDLNLFSESAAVFSLEKDGYYPIKITYISGSKRVPVFVTAGEKKTELNDEIKQVSYGIIPTESPTDNSLSNSSSFSSSSSSAGIPAEAQNKNDTVNQELPLSPTSPGEIDSLEKDILKSSPPVPDELTNTGIDNTVKNLVENTSSTAGSVTEHPLDNFELDPLVVDQGNTKTNAEVVNSAGGKSAPEKTEALVVDLNNAPNAEDVNTKSGDAASKVTTEQTDERFGTENSLEDGKSKVTKDTELVSQNTDDKKDKKDQKDEKDKKDTTEKKQDSDKKDAPKTEVKAKRELDNLGPAYTNTGFFYTLKIVPAGEDYSELLKSHEKLLVVEMGYFDERYTGNFPVFATPYVVEIIGHAEAPIAGKYNLVMTNSMQASIQIGPGVTEKQTEYTIDNKWAIMDNRVFPSGEVELQPNFFYPFRIVLLGQAEYFNFEMNTTGPDGNLVDLFGLWQNETQAQAPASIPGEKNETLSVPKNELEEIPLSKTPFSTNSSGQNNVSGVLDQSSPTLSVASQGKNVSDLVSPGQQALGSSSMDVKTSFLFSARFGFSACVSGSACASPVCPNLMRSETLSPVNEPGKYVVSCDEYRCLDSSPAPQFNTSYKFSTSGPVSLDASADLSASASVLGPVKNEPKEVQSPSRMEDIGLENAPASVKPNGQFPDSASKDYSDDSSFTPKGNSASKEPANDNGNKINADAETLPSSEAKADSSSGHNPAATLYEGSGSKATAGFSFVSCLALLLLLI